MRSGSSRLIGIPRRYAHFVYGILQSGLTTAIAAAIASHDHYSGGPFLIHWFRFWFIAWLLMMPIVLFAAPLIRRLSLLLTQAE
jgi:FtsH-binding integral membrane protein